MNNEFVTRNYLCEVRADEPESDGIARITGRPIVYDSRTDLGYFDEIIEKGALDKSDLNDVRFLVNHDTSKIPLARSRKDNKNSTMKIETDDSGMAISLELDTENNSDARSLYSAIKRGDISGMSFMFGIRGENWDDLDSEHPTRHITDISCVVEVSAVTFPAYESTEISARDKSALEAAKNNVDNARSLNNELALEKLKAEYLYKI